MGRVRCGSCCLVDGGDVMTYEQWWWEFIAEHEDWKYADSDALRRAAFNGGQESLRQQLSAMTAERDKAKAMPMKYRRMEFNAQLQNENESLRQQLADSQKCEVMLRVALERLVTERRAGLASLEGWDAAREALAATADLKDMILCHAEPVAYLDANYGFMRCGNVADSLSIGTQLYAPKRETK